ncbi:acyl-ACP desaturase [Antrihabitans cavernicola]|uniref:Acyl-ACP desaturase n=1 Tax=Antrihabitans cavernicola TaxID=2495913 RepID=A0A5A7SJH1_9NOCA|nr:acyl-ACP desaturase [Spelaeibacter cavernicola]
MNDKDLLDALAPVVSDNLERHIAVADVWQPQDMVPWDDGRNFDFLGGTDWAPEQSTLSDIGKLGLTVGVLAADNMPSYHRELAGRLVSGPWWRWVGRWTAEENRHSIVLRDFLVLTRAVDPVELERVRMTHMTTGYSLPSLHLLEILATAAFDEAASAIRHRNTAAQCGDKVAAAICERIATDDELQTKFFANLIDAALDLAPEQTVNAIAERVREFRVPVIPLPGDRDSTGELATAGIYDPARETELVFGPLIAEWNIAGRTFEPAGEQSRDELGKLTV